jgi:hypothetical protein
MARSRAATARLALGALFIVAVAAATSPANADISDWIARLHGAPPESPKAPPPAELATVSAAPGVRSDPQVESFLGTLARAIKARDGALLAPRLAAAYAVDDLPSGARAADFMAKAIERMPGPRQIVIESIETSGSTRAVKTRFEYAGQDARERTFLLDAAGNLLRSDLFRLHRS